LIIRHIARHKSFDEKFDLFAGEFDLVAFFDDDVYSAHERLLGCLGYCNTGREENR
jgi:hypothetical protein